MSLFAVTELACVRGDRPLFRNLSFELESGQLLHITGQNGCGKTTLLRTLCGLSQSAQGQVLWQDQPIRDQGDEYFDALHFVGHANAIEGEVNALEQLRFNIKLGGGMPSKSPEEALEYLGLSPYRYLPTKLFSQGQQRRLALARLLVVKKPLWILDEPFTALDHATVKLMEQLLSDHVATGGMVILTSHQILSLANSREIKLDQYHA